MSASAVDPVSTDGGLTGDPAGDGADDGLVERERDGRAAVNSLTPTAAAELDGTVPATGTADD